MIRGIVNYFRSCFCNHDFELLAEVETHGTFGTHHHNTYRCRRCGFVQKVRL